MQVRIDGSHLTLDQVVQVARLKTHVVIDPKALSKTSRGRRVLEGILREDRVVYGVNTGFGALSNRRIATDDLKHLQSNLIRSHAVSVGTPHSAEIVRAMMLLRANTLLKGFSGVRAEIPRLIVKLLNAGVHPHVPEKGSVGASGDLSPLSHITLVLMGEGKAEFEGRWISGRRALDTVGEKRLELEAKEGLALNNGTQQTLAISCLALKDAYDLIATCEAALAMSLEAIRGKVEAFDQKIHALRPHRGQGAVASHIRALLEGSSLSTPRKGIGGAEGRPQDPYSFRCAPQVMGASLDALHFVKGILEVEMNSVTDNPIIIPEERRVLSGGNFHGQPVSMGADILGLAVSTLANLSERRTSALLDPSMNNGLPPFLVGKGETPGLGSGLMAVQYTATALVAENKILSHPASSDSIPTSGNFEDFVSMGPGAAMKALSIVKNSQYVVGVELLAAAQGVDLRGGQSLGKGTKLVHRLIRENIEPLGDDRSSSDDLEKIRELVRSGDIAEVVRRVAY